jgi:UDP-3-O-[3-hydroxymyristoyl] glucosamine N-acyltransferase
MPFLRIRHEPKLFDREAIMNRTAGELAKYLGAHLEGDATSSLKGVASPERAKLEDLIYLTSPRHADRAAGSAARCVIVPEGARLTGKTVIEVREPKLAFAKAAAWLLTKPVPSASSAAIHATAVIAQDAKLGASVSVGPYAVIEAAVEVGAGTAIGAFGFIGHGSRIGENCLLHPRVTLYARARLGNRVELHSGVVIGGDGFGYVFGEGRQWKFPQVGDVEIGDDVEIGCNTTVDRGSLDTTRLGQGVKIDNLVQVAHNVQVGEHTVIASQTGISGSSTLGENVTVGGQVGIGDHCTIEDGAMLGGQAGILNGKIIRRRQIVWGTPARPLNKFKEQYVQFARLPGLEARVRKLEQKENLQS